jgi:multicomponent Na+:H+ antiporter subunit E
MLFFMKGSLVGGFDVASRVLRRELDIRPGYQHHLWRLPTGLPRVLAIATLGLQPGTLAARDQGRSVVIHVLDGTIDADESLTQTEELLAAVFDVELQPPGG